MNRKDDKLRTLILHSLCEGLSLRACSRIFGVALDTVQKLMADAGDTAIAFVKSELKDLDCRYIQADELYSFVGTRDFDPDEEDVAEGLGRTWTWLAMDADSKLIISYHIGPRDSDNAAIFMKDVASRLRRDEHGRLVVVPDLVTDGLKAYPDAVQIGFGQDVRYGIAEKVYVNENRDGKKILGQRYKETRRVQRINSPDLKRIHTCYIERQNLNLRMQNRRFTRKTNAFSKTLLNHERQLALWVFYHNFIWLPTRGGVSSATIHGLRPEVWDIKHLLMLTDEFVGARERARKAALVIPEPPQEPPKPLTSPDDPTHWVYRRFHHRSCKVHLSSCCNCRDGAGKNGKQGIGEWLPFFSMEAAMEAALRYQPDRTSICSICLGNYRKRVTSRCI